MALALLSGVKTWSKVKHQLQQQMAHPSIIEQFDKFEDYMTGALKNPDLQMIPFNDADLTTDTGVSPIGAVTSTVYAIYVKKRTTATDSYIRAYNATTNTAIASAYTCQMLSVSGEESVIFFPKGLIFGTDLTISADTGAGAGTESTAGDAGDGFVLVGA